MITCDLSGCDYPGFARYINKKSDEWIDVCHLHRPSFGKSGTMYYYHTLHHPFYPAEIPADVANPNSFKRTR